MRKRVRSQAHGRLTIALAAVLGCLFGAALACAQGGVTIEVGECVKLASPGERLDCYERQVNAAGARTVPPTAPPASAAPSASPDLPPAAAPPAAAAAAAAPAAVAQPAAAPAVVAQPAAAPAATESLPAKTRPPEVTGTITALRKAQPNSWVVTLDNGQVWGQTYPEPYSLESGMHVTLRPSKWGSAYRLSAQGLNGFIQVRRIE